MENDEEIMAKTLNTEMNETEEDDFLKQNLNRKKIIRKFNQNKFKELYTTISSYVFLGITGCVFGILALATILN